MDIRLASPDDGPECDLCGYMRTDVALAHDGRTELRDERGLPFQEPCRGCGDPFRLVVAGSRSIPLERAKRVLHALLDGHPHYTDACEPWGERATALLHGDARGPDKAGAAWGRWKGLPVVPYPAKWDDVESEGAAVKTRDDGSEYNALAGHWRNEELSKDGDALVALWDGRSGGTKDVVQRFKSKDKPVHLEVIE